MSTPLNNTYKHISDESKFSEFDPTGTNFPPTVKNVQEALAMTSPTAYATEQQAGVITIASVDEVLAGVNATKAVTPAALTERLKYPDATTTTKGILFLADNAQALAGTDSSRAIVPSALKHVLEWCWANKTASETDNGVLKLSTAAAAAAGVDDKTAMTPLKVKQAIANATSQIPSYAPASEDAQGLVQLATIGQAQDGNLRTGFSVSPYTLMRVKGAHGKTGLVHGATIAEARAGTDENAYISAVGFRNYSATDVDYGTVKLSQTPGTSGSGVALAANATVLNTNGTNQTVGGIVNFTGTVQHQGQDLASKPFVQAQMPVGSVMMYAGQNSPDGGIWVICNGPQFSRTTHAALFAVIGYTHGGSGDVFYGPDMRGMFVRGVGTSNHIMNERGTDTKGKPKLGNGVDGGRYAGAVQMQQITEHQHATGWGEHYSGNEAPYGRSAGTGYYGSNKSDWDNYMYFTNNGYEIEPESVRSARTTLNRKDLIGTEVRPWNMSMNYIIKVA